MGLNFLLVAQWQGFIDSIIWISAGIALILIGAGLWVEDKRELTFWAKVREALKLERSEIGELALSLFRPSAAQNILEILAQFAYIDRDLAEREKSFIQSFAEKWRIEVDWKDFEHLPGVCRAGRFMNARDSAMRYLKTSPPAEQVAQLIDLLEALVGVDDELLEQEVQILDEVRGLLLDYLPEFDEKAHYSVVVVPQNREQDAAISTLLPNVEKTGIAGGSGYVIDTFYSRNYAEVMCNEYRALGFFTVDLIHTSRELFPTPESPVTG